MEHIGTSMQGLAALAWPVIIVLLLLTFRDAVKDVLSSAKSRKFTVRVGGNELTMEENSTQQRILISDLQTQIIAMQKTLDGLTVAPSASPMTPLEAKSNKVKSILWVDDKPRNNASLIEILRTSGIDVETALSTTEALDSLNRRNFDRVISDMGRTEDGRFNGRAGLDLVRDIRAMPSDVPIIIFSSSRSARTYGQEALAAGANEITSSSTRLRSALQLGVEVQF